MTLAEFKAWFEGFTEGMDKTPTQKQWARIKERVGEINGVVTTERVFIDRYWPTWYPAKSYEPCTVWLNGAAQGVGVSNTYATAQMASGSNNIASAFYTLGLADALELKAA